MSCLRLIFPNEDLLTTDGPRISSPARATPRSWPDSRGRSFAASSSRTASRPSGRENRTRPGVPARPGTRRRHRGNARRRCCGFRPWRAPWARSRRRASRCRFDVSHVRQWLHMKITKNTGASAKSVRDTVRPSIAGSVKSGAGVPSGTMAELTATMRPSSQTRVGRSPDAGRPSKGTGEAILPVASPVDTAVKFSMVLECTD